MQFGIPSQFVILNADTFLMAFWTSLILVGALLICYYAMTPLLNKNNIFRRSGDLANLNFASSIGIVLVITSTIIIVGFFHSYISIEQFSWSFIGGISGFMILLVTIVTRWGLKSRNEKKSWYAKIYLYFERKLMIPLSLSILVFLVVSYLVAGQLAIKNWQEYVKEPDYVLVDGKDEYILVGVFGEKVGVVKESEFGIEGSTQRFIDMERITFKTQFTVDD